MKQIIITIITACVPSLISYLVTKKQMDTKLKQIKLESESKLDQLKTETELRIKESQQNQQIELTNKFMSGELDIAQLIHSVNSLVELESTLAKLSKK